MAEEAEFTLSGIAEATRQSKRTVQLWADAGVIKAKPSTMLAGSGVHRRFGRNELIIACVVSPFAKQKVSIGGLDTISVVTRSLLTTSHRRTFERGINQEGQNYLLVYWAEGKGGELRTCGMNTVSDIKSVSFFDTMGSFDDERTRAAKVDAISLNEVFRDIPKD